MLRLLLDEHLSSDIAIGFRRIQKGLQIESVHHWEGARFLGAPDELLLHHATAAGWTLVTYDLKTIPPLLKTWAEGGRDHAGIILVDEKTIPPWDFGGIIRSLHRLWQETARWDWTNRTYFLR